MIMLFAPNFPSISQLVLGKNAVGLPYREEGGQTLTLDTIVSSGILTQLSVLILSLPSRTSAGGEPSLGQNQTLMKDSVRSKANKPPLLALKAGPNEFPRGSATLHPALPFTKALQSVSRVVPV